MNEKQKNSIEERAYKRLLKQINKDGGSNANFNKFLKTTSKKFDEHKQAD